MNLKEKPVVIDNNTYRYSNIVMLETDKQGQFGIILVKDKRDNLLHLYRADKFSNNNLTVQHLYFLSSDKICEGDLCYNSRRKSVVLGKYMIDTNEFVFCYKIIASTDSYLNLPKPSDSFLQAYIDAYKKGEKIEQCLVEYENFINSNPIWNPKNPLSNVVFRPKVTKSEITIKKIKDSWSNEEVEQLCRKAYREGAAYSIGSHDNFKQIHLTENEWISENLYTKLSFNLKLK